MDCDSNEPWLPATEAVVCAFFPTCSSNTHTVDRRIRTQEDHSQDTAPDDSHQERASWMPPSGLVWKDWWKRGA